MPSCAGAYVSGAAGSNECPAGSVRIEAEAACLAAATAAGKTPSLFGFVETSSTYPRGCYYDTTFNFAQFNPHAVGAGESYSHLLCAAVTGPTGTVRVLYNYPHDAVTPAAHVQLRRRRRRLGRRPPPRRPSAVRTHSPVSVRQCSAVHASYACCRRGRSGRLRNGFGRAVDVELRVVPAGWMRDCRAERHQRRGFSKFSEHTAHARRHGASGTGRPVVHRQDSEHVRPLSPRCSFLCSPP